MAKNINKAATMTAIETVLAAAKGYGAAQRSGDEAKSKAAETMGAVMAWAESETDATAREVGLATMAKAYGDGLGKAVDDATVENRKKEWKAVTDVSATVFFEGNDGHKWTGAALIREMVARSADKVEHKNPDTGKVSKRNRIPGGVREIAYNAAKFLRKQDGATVTPDALEAELAPSEQDPVALYDAMVKGARRLIRRAHETGQMNRMPEQVLVGLAALIDTANPFAKAVSAGVDVGAILAAALKK